MSPTAFRSIHTHGFARVAGATPRGTVGDPARNAEITVEIAERAHDEDVDLVVFPELNLSSYAVDDLHLQGGMHHAVADAIATVVAAGGGAPCHDSAMDEILAAGPCVWLSASMDVIAGRVIESEERPLLGTVDVTRIVAHLTGQLKERESVYTRAPYCVRTDTLEPLAVVEAIESELQASGEGPWAP